MSEQHPEISEDRLFYFEKQEVVLSDFAAQGYILDIGGGGEGIIGRLKDTQVVAIDPNRRELEEAPSGPLKVVMDARDLQFLDGSFSVATSFFTLMYIPESDHKKVFDEVFRVLVPGGHFLIWGVVFPERPDPNRDIAIFPLSVKLPNQEISTGYGALWPDKARDLSCYLRLGKEVGFQVISERAEGHVVYIELRKPG